MLKAILTHVLLIVLGSVAIASATPAQAEPFDKPVAQRVLAQQLELLTSIEVFVERPYLPRLSLIRNSTQAVQSSVEDNGIMHMETTRAFQNLIVQYRFSKTFFAEIETSKTEEFIQKLLELSNQIKKAMGFDDSPYTKIIAQSFTQIQRLLNQVEQMPVKDGLKKDLHSLWPAVGNVISKANEGDRPKAFAAAMPVIESLRKLYGDFDQIIASEQAYRAVLELQGLAEFCAEYSQLDEMAEKQK